MTTSAFIRVMAATLVLAAFDTTSALVVGGMIFSVLLSRMVNGGQYLEAVLLVSYGLRVALAIGFYVVSAYQLPILYDLQLGEGFWNFARDTLWYHRNAVQIAEAFRWGTEIPPLIVEGKPFLVDPDFYLIIGFAYRILGAHPLHIPLLNATLWSAISIVVYLLARRMKGEGAGRIAVLLVGFWPSACIWSSQILKDTLVIFLLLSALSLCMLILEQRHRLWFTAVIPLVPVVFLIARIRFYLLPMIVLAIGGIVVFALVRLSSHRQWGVAVRGLALMGILLATFVLARSIDPIALLSPSRPDIGHLRKAKYLEAQGDHAVAAKEYQRALALNPKLTETQSQIPRGSPQPESRLSEPILAAAKEYQRALALNPKLTETQSFSLSRIRSFLHHLSPYAAGASLRQVFSLGGIASIRKGFASSGGASNVGENIELHDSWSIVAFLPRGLAYALFAPFPWEWFSTEGDTGLFRLLSGIEVVLIFVITPFLLAGIGRAACSGRLDAWLLLAFGIVAAIMLGLVITNIGILFRLRLQFLIPTFVILAAYGVGKRCQARALRR